MSQLTIFSWGYWGWGNTTPQWVEWVDGVEAVRGFNPPLFVDIRISRSVRARGFNGNGFGDLLGRTRYRHMPSLGNLSVLGKTGPAVQIKDPAQAAALLELAFQLAERRQRLIFFCSCEYPRLEGNENACHRVTVARLLLEGAHARKPVEIVEWPGGEPKLLELHISPLAAKKLLRGAKSLPLGPAVPHGEPASVTWGSIVRLRSADIEFPIAVGPPRCGSRGWFLPLPWATARIDATVSDLLAKARQWRREFGFEPRSSGE